MEQTQFWTWQCSDRLVKVPLDAITSLKSPAPVGVCRAVTCWIYSQQTEICSSVLLVSWGNLWVPQMSLFSEDCSFWVMWILCNETSHWKVRLSFTEKNVNKVIVEFSLQEEKQSPTSPGLLTKMATQKFAAFAEFSHAQIYFCQI